MRRRSSLVIAVTVLLILGSFAVTAGRELLAENRRLEYAGDIKTAYTVLRTRLEPLLAEAESVRYAAPDDERRAELVARALQVTNSTQDETGVATAYYEWIRWLVHEPGAGERLVEVRETHADNPFTNLVCAWSHLRSYADAARWPADDEVLLHAIPRVANDDTFSETPEMKALLRSALADLDRARKSDIWQRVPELRWVEDLSLGFAHYAEGRFDEAIEHLERVGAYNDLPFEPSLILSFAYLRRGDLDQAFESIEPLLQRRPDHVTAARALASCYKRRAIVSLREFGGGLDDLYEARRLMRSISAEPETDQALANMDLFVGLARMRMGEDASAEFASALEVFERTYESDTDDFRVLGGMAQCLVNLGGKQRLERAAELSDRMLELQPNHSAAHEVRIGIELMSLKDSGDRSRITEEQLANVEQRLTQAQELVGDQPTLLYYRVNLLLLRADIAANSGQEYGQWLQLAVDGANQLSEVAPDFHRARFLAWWTSSYFEELRRPSAGQMYEDVIELRAPFVSRGMRSPFDVQLAQRMEQLAGTYDSQAESLRFLVYAYGLVVRQAEAEPERADWLIKATRLASRIAELEQRDAQRWHTAAFEHSRSAAPLASASGPSGAWSSATLSGVRAWVHGADDLHSPALETAARALAAGEEQDGVRIWIAWLARGTSDEARALVELTELRAKPLSLKVLNAQLTALNDSCWRIARELDLDQQTYERALVGMRLCVELTEGNGATLNTMGVLEARLGEWHSAREHLLQSLQLNALPSGIGHPGDIAFLALCARALDDDEQAERWRSELEGSVEAWQLEDDEECRAFREEVREAFEGKNG